MNAFPIISVAVAIGNAPGAKKHVEFVLEKPQGRFMDVSNNPKII